MRNRAMSVSETCKVAGCGRNRTEHAAGEKDDSIHHAFSAEGNLEFKESTRSPRQVKGNSQKSKGRLEPTTLGDPVLRFILIQQGIIKPEQLTEAEKVLRASGVLHT